MRSFVDHNERLEEVRAALGLGQGSGRIRALLAIAHGNPLTLSELADKLNVDAPYATLIVNHLEAIGLASRSPDPDNRRRKLVSPTAAGEAAVEAALSILNRPPAALSRLDPGELTQLRACLERLAAPAGGPDLKSA